jgi:nucleoid-associated protein EbfC
MQNKPDMPNMNELMKKAQEMQQKMKWTQTELASAQVTGVSGGNLIQIIMNGRHEVIRVIIDDSALQEGKAVLQDLIAAACNDANRKVEKVAQEKMYKLARELGLPEDGKAGGTAGGTGGFGGMPGAGTLPQGLGG